MGESLTVEQVAPQLHMNPAGVRRLIRLGKLQAVKVGKRYLIAQEEVDRVLREGTEPIILAGGRAYPRKGGEAHTE